MLVGEGIMAVGACLVVDSVEVGSPPDDEYDRYPYGQSHLLGGRMKGEEHQW